MNKLISEISLKIEGTSKEFFESVWLTPETVYKNRLSAIGFEKFDRVLDAGCGFGQWTSALSSLNKNVEAIELNKTRINISKILLNYLKKSNINICDGSITKLPYRTNTFDGIFSYSVIYFSDYRESLKEFFRVLKPGGKLYFCTNDYGWYLYNFLKNKHHYKNYSSRKMALETFYNTLKYYCTHKIINGKQHILTKNSAIKLLEKIGYKNILSHKDGGINFKNLNIKNFYPEKKYGITNVYEILCEK